MTKEEWQTEKNRLAVIANDAWSNYGHAHDVGGNTTSLFMMAKDATDTFDRHGELEPGEPTITLTRAQVVTLFKSTLPSNIKVAGQCLRQLGVKEGSLFADYVNDLHQESRSLCRLLGAPEEWVAVLVEGVRK